MKVSLYNWKFIQNVEYKEVHGIGQKEMKNYQLDNAPDQLIRIRVSKNRILSLSKNTWLLKQENQIASWMECVAKYNCKEDKWEKSRYRNYLKTQDFQW